MSRHTGRAFGAFCRLPRAQGRRWAAGGVRWNSSGAGSGPKKSSAIRDATLLATGAVAAIAAYSALSPSAATSKPKTEASEPPKSTLKLQDCATPVYADEATQRRAFAEIKSIVGPDNVSASPAELDAHSDTYFQTHHAPPDERPALIVRPGSTEEVSAVLRVCHREKIPVVPFSGGTSLEGHINPTRCGITLDMSRMDSILALHKEDLDVVVQPAVGWEDLDEFLADQGLLFGPDPGPGAEIGGMIGTACSGTNAARYGTMRENVLAVTAVLADGTIVKTRQRPRKSSAGYNLTGLFVGSEGTLAVITEAVLKLHVRPAHETVAVVSFPSVRAASDTVTEVVQQGILVNAVELLDANMMRFVNEAGTTSRQWREQPTLFFKFGGTEAGVAETVAAVKEISHRHESQQFEFARNADEMAELWSARKNALWSTIDYGRLHNPKTEIWTTDVAVPISRLAEMVEESAEDFVASGLETSIVGHVGDGNFHAFILYDPSQHETAHKLVDRMVERALRLEGTCTGEHGVGIGKRDYLLREVGEEAVDTMRKVKAALDPQMLLNTDKVFRVDPNEKSGI